MTAHELAKALLAGPDLPVIINGSGSDEGDDYEAEPDTAGLYVFNGQADDENTPRDRLGYKEPRPAIRLDCCPTKDWA